MGDLSEHGINSRSSESEGVNKLSLNLENVEEGISMDIVERFISYAKIITTTSRENGAKGIMPSSPGQNETCEIVGE